MLLCLAHFEVDLRKRLQKLPAPTILPEVQPPTTDAELITDFRQEQWRNSRDKMKLQEETVPTKVSPETDGDSSRRHRLRELERNPEISTPKNYCTDQQWSPMRNTEVIKDVTDYHREDHHRTPLSRQRGSELHTRIPGYTHARRRTRVQLGST